MQKVLLSLASVFFVSGCSAGYTHTIRNYTQETVVVRVDIIAGFDVVKKVKPPHPDFDFKEKLVDVGAYCTRAFEVDSRFGLERIEIEEWNKCQCFTLSIHYKDIENPEKGIEITVR